MYAGGSCASVKVEMSESGVRSQELHSAALCRRAAGVNTLRLMWNVESGM